MSGWSLAGRLAWVLTALIALHWLGASFLSALTLRQEIIEVSDASLAGRATAFLSLVSGTPDVAANVPPSIPPDELEDFAYLVRDGAGTVIARSAGAPETPFDVPLVPGFADDDRYRVYTARNADGTRWVQFGEVHAERREAVQESVLNLIWPLGLLLVLVAVAIRALMPRLTAPIRLAQNEIAARGGGNLDPIPPLGLPRELAPIVEAVNRLLMRLRKLLDAERAFASNSAHELRTPVAAALAQAQVLASELEGPAKERARSLASQISALGHTVEKLLQLSRAEAGVGLAREAFDLNQLAAAAAEPFLRHSRRGSRITVMKAPAAVIVEADLDVLGIALENLIDNAFAHAGPDAKVTVTVGVDGSIAVADDGRGIDPERLASLHERFVRGGIASGSGLGLAIASTIADQSGGKLVLESPGPGRGFTATLRLPLSARSASN